MVFGWQRKFSNGGNYSVTMIYSWGGMHSFDLMSGEETYFPQLNAFIRLRKNVNKILHTVVYTKDLGHTTRDFTVKYTYQPKI